MCRKTLVLFFEFLSHSHSSRLIIGAGPSGLMAAYWMACCGIRARIVDKRGNKVFRGQADGLAPRAMEIFDSMGVHDRIMREGIAVVDNMAWVCPTWLLAEDIFS